MNGTWTSILGQLLTLLLAVSTSCLALTGCRSFRQAPLTATSDDLAYNLDNQPEKPAVTRALDWTKNQLGYGPDQALAEQWFAEAKARYDQIAAVNGDAQRDDFLAVAKDFEKAASRWPNSKLQEKALFLAGESYFFAERYPKAEDAFARLIKNYPNTHYVDTVDQRRFAIGTYWIEKAREATLWVPAPNLIAKDQPVFDMFNHGVRVLDRIRLDDPTGRLADDATMAAAMAHFERGNYLRADELLTDLRQSFPNSEHQFAAHLQSIKAKTMIYQGAGYDGAPLEGTEQLLRQIQRQFPREADEHREFLVQVAQDVRLNKALREWHRAQYFDRRKQYGAARQYYARIRDEFSDTSLASQAADRLADIGDQPNRPPQYLPWLVDMLPESQRVRPLLTTTPMSALQR